MIDQGTSIQVISKKSFTFAFLQGAWQ